MNSEELHRVFLSLGSNLGDKEENIRKAISLIGERVGLVLRQSSLISTEPWGFESDNRFVNAAVLCETMLSPREVLLATQQIERELGRTHKSVGGHYADRLIDIDILLYDDLRVDEPDLQIPHPLMLKRDFVMIPLREIRD
ncbi:2-amino-4-hydroxy-6-hydroxymethyldihydropteridine diphosphokinase [Prevotella sp. P6B1]|uniref:2-amino-4-hydroxy-6- hydroxymethyldihydropteridine diphosphokinase n=1 Tax=Prevotella sp. P6B1 TaxID=1410613 RepID=UPI00051C445A|nr:2-amino-4-hydroxy-6-hydroxymethyldihydropteridine diphosphokinase [Prevotella sp. P6B1]